MKKFLIIIAVSLFSVSLFANNPAEVNEKVKKSFTETFTDVKNPEWYDNGDSYLVRFIKDGIDNRIYYDTNGNITNTVRYYKGKDLPAYIQGKLKKKFSDKEVFGVTELNSPAGLEYHITLQDNKKWVVLKATPDGNMEVYKKFNKQ